MQSEDIRFYCGAGNETTYTQPVDVGGYACISPVYGKKGKWQSRVSVSADCRVFQDSGAFSDNIAHRLTFPEAMERQNAHALKWGYADCIEAQASYDLLIDETWTGQLRHKRRWSVADAESAVDITVAAAKWISDHRHLTSTPRLILSAQGVDAPQYLRCAERVMPYMREGDVFGLGGWCIIGMMSAVMMPTFNDTLLSVIPFLAREGVKRVHIWGVLYAPALGRLLAMCDKYGLEVSTDSAGPIVRITLGQWGYDDWKKDIPKLLTQKEITSTMTEHVKAVRSWLANFRQKRKHYRLPVEVERYEQMSLF